MVGKSHIVSIGADQRDKDPLELTEALPDYGPASAIEAEPETVAESDWDTDWDAEVASRGANASAYALPALAGLAIAGWTAVFAYGHRAEMMAGAGLTQWLDWISAWAMPVALIVALWLLGLRTSRREQSRFADTAALMSTESARLEERLSVVNRELSLAREFIASQSRDLESLGRVAAERLSANAAELRELIADNGQRIDQIADVSEAAMENMTRLRGDLPVIANSARDVSNQIGAAGRTAHGQVEELATALQRVNEFGKASERQVQSVKDHASGTISYLVEQVDNMADLADTRFGELKARGEEFRSDLDGQEVAALAGIRRRAETLREELQASGNALEGEEEQALISLRARLTALRDEGATISRAMRETEESAGAAWDEAITRIDGQIARLDRDLATRGEQAAEREAEALEATQARLADFDAATSERQAALIGRADSLAERETVLAERMAALVEESERLAEFGDRAERTLSQALSDLQARFATGRTTLAETETAIGGLTDASVRLLELVQATAQQSQTDLPRAMGNAETTLTDLEQRTASLGELFERLRDTGAATVSTLHESSAATVEGVERLTDLRRNAEADQTAATQRLSDLQGSIAELDTQTRALSGRVSADLADAIAKLRAAHGEAISTLEDENAARVQTLADQLGQRSADAIERALNERSRVAIEQLDSAITDATARSREATGQLRDQLAKVAELTANLESRIAHARQRAEEQVDNEFARRVALITESLNSNAIDISKAMSSAVTDTEWNAYLRGDRGIFTRRAVRLLDKEDARDIATLFEQDSNFHEHVSRYIHDFEAMLRTMLSTRDGNALAVTLLSSDMGKLYVALAQGIERLRS